MQRKMVIVYYYYDNTDHLLLGEPVFGARGATETITISAKQQKTAKKKISKPIWGFNEAREKKKKTYLWIDHHIYCHLSHHGHDHDRFRSFLHVVH